MKNLNQTVAIVQPRDKPFWAPKSIGMGSPVLDDGLKVLLPLLLNDSTQI